MTEISFGKNDAVKLYTRVSKLNPTTLLERVEGDPEGFGGTYAEGKKRQILAQTKNEVLERIKDAQ
jgi:hypothetical protein